MATRAPVPVRTILATIGIVIAALAGILIIQSLARIIAWLVVAAFIAVILNPAVDFLERRARLRRAVAAMLVFLLALVTVTGMLYLFVRPLVTQAQEFGDKFPAYVEDAQAGKGAIGRLVKRYDIDTYIEKNQDKLRASVRDAGAPALSVLRTVANTVFAGLTILVLSFLMLLEGPRILEAGLNTFDERPRERIRRVAADCSKAVTGYMAGNLLISVIAGVAVFIFLSIVRVPFSGVLALWVSFADLIPLVGATLGAIPAVGVAFLHSPGAGLLTIGFFIVYQQFENHVLQVTIMSRTVDLNPLAVLVSVLVGVELSGLLGALLAIPAAGVIQVIVRDIYDGRRGRLKDPPTTGIEETPIPEPDDEKPQPAKRARKASKASKTSTKRT
ncbi:MAG TPA: AI-2E family transporter [Acidimicrobiales bacterium]|nr:AI-2E family transporter [Acidimicrobiales bacterium]